MKLIDELTVILKADWSAHRDLSKLAVALYNRCYASCILDGPPAEATRVADDLTPALIAANCGRPSWDEGWRIDQLLDGGSILARKAGAARSFLPGEFLTHRGIGSGPEPTAKISIFVPVGSTELQAGYYYAFSETVSDFDESEWTVRLYWNVTREGAPRLMEAITRDFNRFQIPFRFKCANKSSDYPRRDAAVLYVHARYYPIAASVAESIHEQVRAGLNVDTPLFTRRLADGLALSEDPGESFGENRMRILAAAILACRGQGVEQHIEELRRQFEQRGLSFEQPWLNSGSIDRYPFPYPLS